MNWDLVSIGFQVEWLIVKNFVLPVLLVCSVIAAFAYWDETKRILRIISRTISFGFLLVAYGVLRVIDGKEMADMKIKGDK